MLAKRYLLVWFVSITVIYSPGLFAEAVPCWALAGKKKLEFVFDQAGSEERGVFENFSALFLFDPEKPQFSRFSVSVDLASLNSGDEERDQILRSKDMFDVERWPQASFEVFQSETTGAGKYQAQAKLTIREQTRTVFFPFTISLHDGGQGRKMFQLSSQLELKRLDFGVGQGDWVETTWISDAVLVNVDVQAAIAADSECAGLQSAD